MGPRRRSCRLQRWPGPSASCPPSFRVDWTAPLGGISVDNRTVASFMAFGLFMFAPTVPPILEKMFDAVGGPGGVGGGVQQAAANTGAGLARVGRFFGIR